ncbi:MAG: diacylglycerol/lipid kinase family protein [Chloroflexota bacterium]
MKQTISEGVSAKARPVLIVNTRSRRGARSFAAARRELGRLGLELAASYPVENESDLTRVAQESLAQGSRLLVVGGGDGTISSMADLLADSEAALGLLPLGTGNDFARALGLPTDLHAACRALVDGVPTPIPLAHLNDRYYTNMVLIGRPAHVNHSVPNWLKRVTGTLAYPLAAFFAALRAVPFRASLVAGATHVDVTTTLIAVGNGRFRGETAKELGPEPRRHLLVAYAPRDASRRTLLRIALHAALRRRPSPDLLLSLTGEHLAIDTEPVQEIDVDGEYYGVTPTRIDLVPAAIRVVMPRAAVAAVREAPRAVA